MVGPLALSTKEAPPDVDTHSGGGAPPALALRDVWFSYVPGHPVLTGVSIDAALGQITMLLGTSGSGKTTILKLVKGLLVSHRGSIQVLGRPVAAAARGAQLDAMVAYIPQHLGLVRNLPVLDNVITGALGQIGTLPSLARVFPEGRVREAHALLEQLGIGHKSREKVHTLSGGERQRVAIARALMQRPRLILADEFISHLDPITSIDIMEIMREIASGGVALVTTTHELHIVARYADRVVVLRRGRTVLNCPAAAAKIEDLAEVMRR